MSENVIYSINGPVVKVKNAKDFSMLEMVYVGHAKLMGEVISISKDLTTIQVYETTTGLKPGEPVISTGSPICVTLGPGILRNIFDGIERPLQAIAEQSGAFIEAGSDVDSLDVEKLWDVTMKVKVGDVLKGGDIYATCPETDLIEHRCMLSPLLSGKVVEVKENHIYFRVHPNVQAAYTKEISTPSEADESGYRLRFSLEDGDKVDVGGYVISRKGDKICTDRSCLFGKYPNHRVKFETPEMKGFEIEVYVNPNQISVFVNDGEAVITNAVYDLGKEIETDVKMRIETLEK